MRELTRPLLWDWSGTVSTRQVLRVLLLLRKNKFRLFHLSLLGVREAGPNSWAGKLKFDHYLISIRKTQQIQLTI